MQTQFNITDNAAKRIAYLLGTEPQGSVLRVSVLGGGCSGFQYHYDFDQALPASDDTIFDKDGARIVIDETSLELLKDCTFDYIETLGSAAFEIKNPQATAKCGCGNSFSVA